MDPISVALAVISFGTALKDIIEIADAIRDSLSKQPRNYRDASELSERVLRLCQQLKTTYDNNTASFESNEALQVSILVLRKEMQSVHDKCRALIQPTSEKKLAKLKIAFYSFWRRGEVERLIRDLRRQVKRSVQDFTALSTVRSEIRIVEMHRNFASSTARTTEIREILLAEHGARIKRPNPTHLATFTGSSDLHMTKILDNIPTHIVEKAYLRREVERIFIPRDLISSGALHAYQQDAALVTRSWNLQLLPTTETITYQSAVSSAIYTQCIFRGSPASHLVGNIDAALVNLNTSLYDLGLFEESLYICRLLVDFWKGITRQLTTNTFLFRLADSIHRLGITFRALRDPGQAYLTSLESFHILQSISTKNGLDMPSKLQMVDAIAQNLQLMSKCGDVPDMALQRAEEAIRLLEQTLTEYDRLATESFSDMTAVLDDLRYTHARCLFELSKIQLTHFRNSMESEKLTERAMEVLDSLSGRYPDSNMIQKQYMNIVYDLTNSKTRSRSSVSRNLQYLDRNTALCREYLKINPQRYVMRLFRSLWMEQEILIGLGREQEADTLYREMVGMGHLAAIPPHHGIKIPSKIEARYYYELALRHVEARRYTEGILAAQNSISQHSALEYMEPGRDQEDHIWALSLLCYALLWTEQYDAALTEGFKALDMIDREDIRTSQHSLMPCYEDILQGMVVACHRMVDNFDDARVLSKLKVIKNHIERLSHLTNIRPVFVDFYYSLDGYPIRGQ